jgi:gamma-glutamyltranspeptidase/glutathione hydrolase
MGGAASVTTTLNSGFGAGVIAADTGFLLNDEMDDFSIMPDAPNLFGLVQGKANAIAPGKRPLSSMAPTIVLRNGSVEMVLGSPGGPRIITAIVETILNMIDYGMTAQEAVDAPRFHHQWLPDALYAEPLALSPDTAALLEQMGYHIKDEKPSGAVALIASGTLTGSVHTPSGPDTVANHAPEPDVYYGANDSRRPAGIALAP